MKSYKTLLETVLREGTAAEYRNGTRISSFGHLLKFDLREGFPLVTLKKTAYHDAFVELLWMIRGSTRVSVLDGLGIKFNFWKPWAINDSIGNLYGKAWRHAPNNGYSTYTDSELYEAKMCPSDRDPGTGWRESSRDEVDQLANVVHSLKTDPYSSRHRIAVYIPEWAANNTDTREENIRKRKGVLTPCASFLQFTVAKQRDTGQNVLNLHVTQASSDVLIGLPGNIAQYALFLALMAREVKMEAGVLCYAINDAHVYSSQLAALSESGLLEREPLDIKPTLTILGDKDLFNMDIKSIHIAGYESHPFVAIPVSL